MKHSRAVATAVARGVAFVLILALVALARPGAGQAQNLCASVDAAFPLPGREGGTAPNSFRPLPELAPLRTAATPGGTLALSLTVDHVSPLPTGEPGWVYVGNYRVTDLPVMRVVPVDGTTATVIDPASARGIAIPPACLVGPDWGYAGTQWAVLQGDHFDFQFQSRLDYSGNNAVQLPSNGAVPCRSSNLHTHGLLVSTYHPSVAGRGPYGDYVLDVTQPRGSHDFGTGTDDCGTQLGDIARHGHGITDLPLHITTPIPGVPHESGLGSGEHPSGLFWYHPHPHGFSRQQVSGGTTGAITIGDLTDYACPPGDGTPGHCDLGGTPVRLLSLKDTEILPLDNGFWSVVHDDNDQVHHYDPAFCATYGAGRHGECQAVDGSNGKWIFSVNGVEFPVIRAAAGRGEIWRLLNASPNMTYHLRLTADGPDGVATALPFQLLAKDGVAIRQVGSAPVLRQDVLMMPASRLEIYIPAPAAGGHYVLRNEPAETGANGGGDTWPEVDLAEIDWPTAAPQSFAAASGALSVAAPLGVAERPVRVATDGTGLPANCIFRPGDSRVIYFVHRFNSLGNEVFGLIAGLRHADGGMDFFNDADPTLVLHSVRDVWASLVNGADQSFPAFMHNPYGSVCTVRGNVESWELQNWSSENHNFHIHQSRFTIDPNGAFAYPLPEFTEDRALRATDAAIRSFADLAVPTYNDTVPVPRGQSFCAIDPRLPGCKPQFSGDNLECTGEPEAPRCANPGKMTVLLDFSRTEQVGTFVYHCHILEHEDGGMMARVTVQCPPGDTSCLLQAASAPICRARTD